MADLFNIGLAGLRAQQAALAVTGQNITNASTPGYSRQRVEMEPQITGTQGSSFNGSGVRVDQIARMTDRFAVNQMRLDTALHAELDTFASQIGQIEGFLLNDNSGLDETLKSFFNALQLASNNPTDTATRQVVLGEAERLSGRFQLLNNRIDEQRDSVVNVIATSIVRINELAGGIAELNGRLAGLRASEDNSGAMNALLDQREEMLRDLSSFVGVKVTEAADGQVSVFIGKGQSLVIAGQAGRLELTPQREIALFSADQRVPTLVTETLTGGQIGGALTFQDRVLDATADQLGRLALAVTAEVNRIHTGGVDLNGERGGSVFADLNTLALARARVSADEDNLGPPAAISLTVDDPLQVPISDYELVFDSTASGAFFVRRGADGAIVFQGRVGGELPQTVSFDSMSLTLESGAFTPGDVYHLTPLRMAAGAMERVLDDPALLALAGPVRAAEDPANAGTGTVELGEVFDLDHPIFGGDAALPPLIVRFTSETSYEILDNSDPVNPQPLDPPLSNLPYTPGRENSLLPDAGATLVRFDEAPAGLPPASASIQPGIGTLPNDYPPQTYTVTERHPETGAVLGQQSIALAGGSSARQIAADLSTLPGVSARAETEAHLTDLVDDGAGTPLGIAINGVDLGNVTSLNDLADAVNANDALASLGIQAVSDGTTLRLRAVHGDDLTVQVSGDAGDGLTIRNPNDSADFLPLNGDGAGNYATATVGGVVSAWLDADVELSSPTDGIMDAEPVHERADLGFEMFLTGRPAAGDVFTIDHNATGIGDNRNGLELAGLLSTPLIGSPPRTFTEDYASLVQIVGEQSSQAQISRDAASSLLQQSTARREAVAGVNLDEEAANLIRFEQAYNASAQIISVARDTFNTLIGVVR